MEDIEGIANSMIDLLNDYQYWVWKLTTSDDGQYRLVARPGYIFGDCLQRIRESPVSGTLEDMRCAIDKAKILEGISNA